MNIKKKTNLLIATFSALLVLNGVGIFYALAKIKSVNEHLIEETKITQEFLKFSYILKTLQEVSTDIALMGDKDGIKELESVKKEYLEQHKIIDGLNINEQDKKHLADIDAHFNTYFKDLKVMSESGIKRVDARLNSLKEMKVFDKAVSDLENSVQNIKDVNQYALLKMKYDIVSIQEIITDALAVGDIGGFSEIDSIHKGLNRDIKRLSTENPSLKATFSKLKSNISDMVEVGKRMAKRGEEFSSLITLTRDTMEKVDSKFEILEKDINSIVQIQEEILEKTIADDLKVISFAEMILITLTIFFILAVVFLVITARGILVNIQKLDVGVKNLLESDEVSKVDINTNDEIGNISNNFNAYLDGIQNALIQDRKAIDEARKVMGKVEVGLLNDRVRTKASSREVNRMIEAINQMIEKTQANITTITDALVLLANANYEKNIPRLDGVTGLIAAALDGTKVAQSTANEVMALIDNANKRLTFSADDLTDASTKLSTSANEQAAALEQTAAAIEEVTSTIEGTSESAAQMSQYAQEVTRSTQEGIELATKTSTSMDALSSEVNTINEAITVIDQIAFQTNILSLNAAVEAATAGEAGKGFAVVAQEVRNLASRSAEAANEIKNLVESATSKAKEGKEVSSEMINGFNKLNENITTTIELIDDVANATKEQREAMAQINDTVNSLDRETQKNASEAANISSMAKGTKDLAVQLQNAVNRTSFSSDAKRRVCDTNMIFDLNKLKSDHINFKNTNFCACKVGESFVVKKHTECDMGKWLIANEDSEFAKTELWQELKGAHQLVHHMVQDIVDLYAEEYENGQIISVTENLELQIGKVFEMIDKLKEHNCDLQFQKSRGV